MNKIGKILVFVNLLFSVITGALIVMVFVTRTQWEKGYNRVRSELVGEQAKFTATINDANKLLAAQTEQRGESRHCRRIAGFELGECVEIRQGRGIVKGRGRERLERSQRLLATAQNQVANRPSLEPRDAVRHALAEANPGA